MLLAGDVGGTNMRLALFDEEDGKLVERRRARFPTRDFATLGAALEGFLAGETRLGAAAFGVAGPVRHGRAEGTNVAFSIDAEEIRDRPRRPRGRPQRPRGERLGPRRARAGRLRGPEPRGGRPRGERGPHLGRDGPRRGDPLPLGARLRPDAVRGGARLLRAAERRGDRAPEDPPPPPRARLVGARRLGAGPRDALPVRARPLGPPRARVARARDRRLRRPRSRRQPRRARRDRPRLPADDAPLRFALRRRGGKPRAEDPRDGRRLRRRRHRAEDPPAPEGRLLHRLHGQGAVRAAPRPHPHPGRPQRLLRHPRRREGRRPGRARER